MNYLSDKDIIAFNQQLQKAFAFDCQSEINDLNLLQSILHIVKNSTVFGIDQFPTLSAKTGHLWYMLARYQIFNNGNKRTAIVAMLGMLLINQQTLDLTQEQLTRQLDILTVAVSKDEIAETELCTFLKQNWQKSQISVKPEKLVKFCLKQSNLETVLARLASE